MVLGGNKGKIIATTTRNTNNHKTNTISTGKNNTGTISRNTDTVNIGNSNRGRATDNKNNRKADRGGVY
jgi:hypothetical protein